MLIQKLDNFEIFIDKYKEFYTLLKKGKVEYIPFIHKIIEILHNLSLYSHEAIFSIVTRSSLINLLINLIRNLTNPDPKELENEAAVNQERNWMLKTCDSLFLSGTKYLKPVQLIKNIEPNFIVPL